MTRDSINEDDSGLMKELEKFYSGTDGHGLDHVRRVHRIAMWLARQVGASGRIVEAASLLHDIAREKEERGACACHAQEGAAMSKPILLRMGYSHEEVENIAYAIASHRFSKRIPPTTLEAEVLQDADRLDALGAIAVARTLYYNGHHGVPIYDEKTQPLDIYEGQKTTAINHFYEKILKITPGSFHTEPAKKVAFQRYRFIILFLKRFKREWSGEDLDT